MIVLGVDPGLADTGWGVVEFDGQHYRPVSFGVIKTKAGEDLQKRVYTIATELGEVALKYKASVVSMEDIFFTKNISSAIPVAKVIGAVLFRFSELSIPVHLFSPLQIKTAVTGMGRAEKMQVQEMVISRNTSDKIASLQSSERENVRIIASLQHREDAMTLFGFISEEERFCFEQLQTVPGIGARQAVRILSGITVQNLIKALDSQDVKTLSKVPGIGPKTAQKLVLQLRNVLVLEEEEETSPSGPVEAQEYRDMVDSFVSMGHDRRVVVRTLSEVLKENEEKLKTSDYRSLEPMIFSVMLKRLS